MKKKYWGKFLCLKNFIYTRRRCFLVWSEILCFISSECLNLWVPLLFQGVVEEISVNVEPFSLACVSAKFEFLSCFHFRNKNEITVEISSAFLLEINNNFIFVCRFWALCLPSPSAFFSPLLLIFRKFLFFIFHYELFFEFRDISTVPRFRWNKWKKNFLDGCGWMHLQEGNFIVIVLNIMLSFQKAREIVDFFFVVQDNEISKNTTFSGRRLFCV